MKIKKYIVLLLLFVNFINLPFLFAQDTFNAKVKEINFIGLTKGSSEELLPLLYVQVGKIFDQKDLDKSILLLYNLDRFENIKADTVQENDGMIINIILKENIIINKINLAFNGKKYSKIRVNREITIEEGSIFSASKLNESINNVKKLYRERGYPNAKVQYKLSKTALPNMFDLTFYITSGLEITIQEINIIGNDSISDSKIKKVMNSKKKSMIMNRHVFDPLMLKNDKSLIISLYEEFGFLDAKITNFSWKQAYKKDGVFSGIIINIEIDEGVPYTLNKVTVSNNSVFTTRDLLDNKDLKIGETYNEKLIKQIQANIQKKYADIGYLYANASVIRNKNEEDKTVDIEYIIFEGKKAHIDNIIINGNMKTRTNVIERELAFEEGELFSFSKIQESQVKLQQLGYFSGVQITPVLGASSELVDIDVSVQEQQTGFFNFGIGYGQESGFHLTFELTEKNILGTGRQVMTSVRLGLDYQDFQLTYVEPWLGGKPWHLSVTFGLYNYTYEDIPVDDDGDGIIDGSDPSLNWETDPEARLSNYNYDSEYKEFRIGINTRVTHPFYNYWSLFFGHEFNVSLYYDANFDTPLHYYMNGKWEINDELQEELQAGFLFQNTLYAGLSYNSTDNNISPTKGMNFRLWLGYTGGLLMGDDSYIRLSLSYNYYYSPIEWFVLALHAESGWMFPQLDGEFDYSNSNLYYFDGTYQMRGWLSYPYRGEAMFYAVAEPRFPIPGTRGYLDLLAFYDVGAIFPSFKDYGFQPENYIMSFGLGARINIPMFPVRFYIAKNVEYNQDSAKFQFENGSGFWEDWNFVFAIQGIF